MTHAASDHYAVLGVSPDTDHAAIKRRYRELARRYHPDVDGSAEGDERIRLLNDAYQALGDPERRVAYDLAQCGRLWGAVTLIGRDSIADLLGSLQYWQYRVFVLDGARVRDSRSFIEAAASFLPLPRDIDISGWDGFEDAMWHAMADLAENRGDRRVAILWTQAHNMLRSGLRDLLLAIDCFRGISAHVGTTEHGFPLAMSLRVFVTGDGPNFPHWHS
jgi:curved DNA-binding protein CbpA